MSSLVIVAVPAEDEYVMKISSEKVPHLTLLYLGEAGTADNLDQIMQFVEHASTTIEPFYMDVERRGTLGEDEADVLFFEKGWDYKMVEGYRSNLLKNPAIKAAYHSAEQYPTWRPHLTLGYPETPANELDTDRKLYSVRFDRIAVWDGDFEGMEFQLKRQLCDREMAMAEIPKGSTALSHFGIKGMRWGVRREAKAVAKLQKKEAEWEQKMLGVSARQGLKGDWNSKATKIVLKKANKRSKAGLRVINNKPEYVAAKKAGLLKKRSKHPIKKQYNDEQFANWAKEMKQAANELPLSPTKSRKIDFWVNENGYWTVGLADLQQMDYSFTFRPVRNPDGEIEDVVFNEDTLEQGEAFEVDGIMHYGIKGMRWGIRTGGRDGVGPGGRVGGAIAKAKAAPAASYDRKQAKRERKFPTQDTQYRVQVTSKGTRKIETRGGKGKEPAPEAVGAKILLQQKKASGLQSLSNAQLKELATRLQLEKQVKELSAQQGGNKVRDWIVKTALNKKDRDKQIRTGKDILDMAKKIKPSRTVA